MTYQIELDISHECPQSVLQDFAETYSLTYELIEEFGPAGGNPLYLFKSEHKINLVDFVLLEICLEDVSEFRELYEPHIKEI